MPPWCCLGAKWNRSFSEGCAWHKANHIPKSMCAKWKLAKVIVHMAVWKKRRRKHCAKVLPAGTLLFHVKWSPAGTWLWFFLWVTFVRHPSALLGRPNMWCFSRREEEESCAQTSSRVAFIRLSSPGSQIQELSTIIKIPRVFFFLSHRDYY
jgi:hypothetical protein